MHPPAGRLALATLIVLALLTISTARASPGPTSQSLTMTVAADGSAVIAQTLATSPSDVSVNVSLLTPIFSYMVITDQNGSPLQYQVTGSNVTVYTLWASSISLQYYTDALTDKQGTVWTLNFTTPYNSTVVLPPGSTVISVSGTPVSSSQQGTSPALTVSPGSWQVEYGVPVSAQSLSSTSSSSSGQTTGSTSSSASTSAPSSKGAPGYLYAAAVVVVAAAVAGSFLYFRRRGSGTDVSIKGLMPDDIQVLNFITEKGGKVFESDIRTRFVLPKTSTWRQIKRLERLGYVKITKVGALNQIELVKNREKQA
jgi:uncharacterized membrane protein